MFRSLVVIKYLKVNGGVVLNYTVIGGRGFIGNEVSKKLLENNHSIYIPERNDIDLFSKSLGTVIFCAGAGDCKNAPLQVFKSNSLLLAEILEKASFDKLIYISSTRLYMGQDNTQENANLVVSHGDERRLFNLSKLISEELCLLSSKKVVIIRPSNVYGLALNSPLFLPAITRNAINNKHVDMYVTPEYAKDYISITDLVDAIYQLAEKDNLSETVYNIASGINTKAKDIANVLESETGCNINWINGCVDEYFPVNDISRLKKEITFNPRNVLDDMKIMIDDFKDKLI
nr:SDR family oxidoreductase [Pseudoalteromonas arctica]